MQCTGLSGQQLRLRKCLPPPIHTHLLAMPSRQRECRNRVIRKHSEILVSFVFKFQGFHITGHVSAQCLQWIGSNALCCTDGCHYKPAMDATEWSGWRCDGTVVGWKLSMNVLETLTHPLTHSLANNMILVLMSLACIKHHNYNWNQ